MPKKKQIFLISNEDCFTILKNKLKDKTINDLFICVFTNKITAIGSYGAFLLFAQGITGNIKP